MLRGPTVRLFSHPEDLQGPDSTLEDLSNRLVTSRKIQEVEKGQLVAELRAGRQYLKAPKAKVYLIEELLVGPLRQVIASEPPPERIGVDATQLLNWLLATIADNLRSDQ